MHQVSGLILNTNHINLQLKNQNLGLSFVCKMYVTTTVVTGLQGLTVVCIFIDENTIFIDENSIFIDENTIIHTADPVTDLV